jgi:hypothetical protein
MNLYERLKNAGCEIDNHESDLYFKKTEMSDKILRDYELETMRLEKKLFVSEIDNCWWWDVPFMYTPYWEKIK